MNQISYWGTFFFLLLTGALPSPAQSGHAELFGTIQDPSRLPVPQAKITATEQSTNIKTEITSDNQGEYHLIGLAAGAWTLTAEKTGFRPYQQTGITLRIGDQIRQDIKFEIGQGTQSVTVNAAASLLETASGSVSYHVNRAQIETLPLDGRNFIPLVALSPGVALPGGGSLLPRINGSRPRTNEYLYDGISVLQPEPGQVPYYPIVDAMEEFRLNVNAYSPEYGRSNGGTVMVIGKSGGNEIHGTLFEFLRNEDLNARNYFARPGRKPEFRRNQYGGTVGGPVRKNKTFYFGAWQGTRLHTGVTRQSVVPTNAQRNGIFTTTIYDPLTSPRVPFANNTIPTSRIDPIAAQVIQHYPTPNASGANNFARTAVDPDSQDQFEGRLDHVFNDRHRVFARYSYLRDNEDPVTPLPDGSGSLTSGVIGHANTRGDGIVSEYDWTLSPSMLNEARFGYSRRDVNQSSLQNGGISIPGAPVNSFPNTLPIFTVTGFQQIGPTTAANSVFTTSITEFIDTFSIVRRNHTFKLGTDLRREALDIVNPANPTGSYAFTTTGTDSSTGTGGNALASLLLGQVNSFSIDIQNKLLQARAHIAEFFVGDDWRVSNRLTLNIGTRYTLNFPSTEVSNQTAVFNLNTQVLDFPHTARNLECCDFGPRVGLSYRLSDSLVVRSGYGMVWFEQTGITTPFTLPQFPFVQTVGQQSQDNINPAFLLSNGPTVQVSSPNPNSGLGQGVFGTDRNVASGNSQQWNLTLQKTFGKDWNLEAGYLGSKNSHLGLPESNLNQVPAQYLSMGTALTTKVPNPYYGQIPASSSLGQPTIAQQQLLRAYPRFTNVALFRDNVADSEYEAAQFKLEKRVSHGLTLSFAYTFSKLIDTASTYFSQTIFTGPTLTTIGAADAFNRSLERDVSTGDIPNVFSAGWMYQIPRWKKISGWQVGGLVRIQSGDAVPITQATNTLSAFGYAVQRPNRIGNPNDFSNRGASHWFDKSAFVAAGQFQIGNSSRNPIRGPGLQNADLMLGNTFRLSEEMNLEFRAEVFNVSNTPPLNDPNGSFGSAAFGTITSAGNPRDFEFAAKLKF
ncbi:MAG TPA: carboxypeptidase regulatory-like domain-containing protein [Bryobacteraceae bacterium]|nr:carboxypeptidase regulatory-like domain-containing protein [Bryobacteraceae bacterium]